MRAPYSKKNELKEGIVHSVGDYTRDTAPWPPEKNKRVLEILPNPQASVKKESAAQKPQQEHTKPEEPAQSAAPAPAGAAQNTTKPTQKYGRITIIVICLVLVGWLIFLAAQDVPKSQPAAVAPAASRTDSSSIATTPTASYTQYSGKLPVVDMPMKASSYTSLGAPDKELKCKNFDKLEPNRKYINVYWYDDSGELIAAGMCAQWEGDSEFGLKSFSQYYPTQPYEGQTFHSGSATDTGPSSGQSLREDYGDPEDLYKDGDYDDLDEVWDEWEEGWQNERKLPQEIPAEAFRINRPWATMCTYEIVAYGVLLLYYVEILELVRQCKDYSVLGHLDLISRYDKRGSYPFERIKLILTEVLKIVIADGKGIELNTSSHRYGLRDLTPSVDILNLYHDLGGHVITIGSDSHRKEHLGAYIRDAKRMLKNLGYQEFCTFDRMQPVFHSL